MELGNLVIHEFNTTVKANGMFDALPENKATVSTYFAGYVKNITLYPETK
jgi:cobalt-zinc-cadmium efflux system membrane fusion protein